jgi:hypothetical protein
VIDKDTPHDLRADGKEVSAILPTSLLLVHQAQVGFMHQLRALQSVVRPFAAQMAVRQAAEFGVHQRREFIHGRGIASAPFLEELRDLARHVSQVTALFKRDNRSAMPFSPWAAIMTIA